MITRDALGLYADIVSDGPDATIDQLEELIEELGGAPSTVTAKIIERVIELRGYPAHPRMTKLIHLRQFVMASMVYDDSMLARRVIASEMLEISCLTTAQRAYAMLHLGEALEPDQLDIALQLWRDCADFATSTV